MASSIYALKLGAKKLEALKFLLEQISDLQVTLKDVNPKDIADKAKQLQDIQEKIKTHLLSAELLHTNTARLVDKIDSGGKIFNELKALKTELLAVLEVASDNSAVLLRAELLKKIQTLKTELEAKIQNLITKQEAKQAELSVYVAQELNNAKTNLANDTQEQVQSVKTELTSRINALSKTLTSCEDFIKGLITASSTYKGIHIFNKAYGVRCLTFVQAVDRDSTTHEIVKRGTIYFKGVPVSVRHSFGYPVLPVMQANVWLPIPLDHKNHEWDMAVANGVEWADSSFVFLLTNKP